EEIQFKLSNGLKIVNQILLHRKHPFIDGMVMQLDRKACIAPVDDYVDE
ncbi:hypothetical protein CEXT_434091, partial [Caerostris extrusa]